MSHVGVEKGGIRGQRESICQGKEPWLNVMLGNEFGCVLGGWLGGRRAVGSSYQQGTGRAGVGISDVKLHRFQKGGQSFCETSAKFIDSLRTYDIYWESQVDGTMTSFIVG